MGNPFRRAVVREHHFERDIRHLFGDLETGDEFIAGAETLLAYDPEIGVRSAPNSNVWLLPMAPIEQRDVTIYYTFNASTVFLIGIAGG